MMKLSETVEMMNSADYKAGEHQLYNETRDCLLANLRSFAYRYFDTAYPEHASLAGKAIEYILDDFVPYVIDDYRYILNRSSQRMLDPDNELHVKLFEKTVLTHLESGIQDRADLYAEHRAKWDAATLGSIFG